MVVLASLSTLLGLLSLHGAVAYVNEVRWERIFGIQYAFDLVGVGTGQIVGGAPWETTDGRARVNLATGKLHFEVDSLILAVGSAAGTTFTGLDIGSAAGVTQVKGPLVCDVNGSAGGGNAVLVDTPVVSLSTQGDARFTGTVVLPTVCSTEPDIAFLIRLVEPVGFAIRWITTCAVRIP